MNIAVLGNHPNWHFEDLVRAAGSDHQMTLVPWSEVRANLGDVETAGVQGDDFELVLVRGMPTGSLEQVIFAMDALARWQTSGTTIVNSPKSLEACIDKYLSLAMMQSAGLPVPATAVCQTVDQAMTAYDELGGDVVIKPLFGGEGRGMVRVSDPDLALRACRTIVILRGVVYLQRFIEHGNEDVRLLVIGEDVLGMRRRNDADWRTNASRGAVCEPYQPDDDEAALALRAARSVSALIAGVDLIRDKHNQRKVLEINGIPGWKALANVCNVDVARKMIDCLSSNR
ncbi:MAG: ATP-grasp domain-containing protein [Pirellulaceae bacterium]